jgi:AraC-like DNA-binding protein
VLGWGLPGPAIAELLRGTPLVARHPVHPDRTAFTRWVADLTSTSPDLHAIALLEIQAGVRRLLRTALPAGHDTGHDTGPLPDAVRHVVAMARYITEHFREPVRAAEVAAAVHLNPNYAMTLFRQVLGTTVHTYLTDRRIAEAQRQLLTGAATTRRIAEDSGFGSHSGFYAAFTRACGTSPGRYRRLHRGG